MSSEGRRWLAEHLCIVFRCFVYRCGLLSAGQREEIVSVLPLGGFSLLPPHAVLRVFAGGGCKKWGGWAACSSNSNYILR